METLQKYLTVLMDAGCNKSINLCFFFLAAAQRICRSQLTFAKLLTPISESLLKFVKQTFLEESANAQVSLTINMP